MLQKTDKERLDKVLAILEKHSVRFPIAEIVRRTGFNKGHVSSIINEKIPMSENFYETFMKQFEEDKITQPEVIPPGNIPLNDLIEGNKNLSLANKDLAAANLELTKMLKSNSGNNPSSQHSQACIERIAELGAGMTLHWKSKEDGLKVLGRFLAENVSKKVKEGS